MIVVNSDTAHGKLAQMQAHGARVLSLQGFTASPRVLQSTIETLTEIAGECGLSFVVSAYRFCPIGMIGVEAIARELLQQCETPIDHIFVPLGGGGLFAAICRGFEKEQEPRPRIHAVQPTGCPTVLGAFQRGDDNIRPVDSTTRISGLSVPFDIDAGLALRRLRQSGGVAFGVSDEEVFEAQQMLFSHEGLYAEPAGAAALAGLCRARREGIVSSADTVVCLVTGHGFKDPESISLAASRHPVTSVEADALRDTIQSLAKCG
jgi:threonine synthase